MKRYLVSNVADRPHKKIYETLGKGAIFDLESSQHGWSDFSKAQVGEQIFVINKNRKIVLGYQITQIFDNIRLADDPVWGHQVEATDGGEIRVVFGEPIERVEMEYTRFVRLNNITNPKLDAKSGNMLQGFNCAVF
ncbi:hypothetical protein PALB_35540 [Pseudoalteromonas luteoviolacea B = ATCC 29581]|nr:hypothetical protein PALB_35540 [Pseudoalteromonas luteoviolacea B = ATCC 29581]